MSHIRTQIWESPTFTIERIEDKAPRTLIYRIAGTFIANDMYRSLKPVLVLNIFEFTVVPGKEPPALVIFDLTEVPSMDSSGLGLIVTHYISCRNRGIRVIALTELTEPGPFRARTHELGTFYGVFESDRLMAMAGQRLSLPGFVEVSAVCTHPDARGRGYARALMSAVMRDIRQRGRIPFLHAFADNPAI